MKRSIKVVGSTFLFLILMMSFQNCQSSSSSGVDGGVDSVTTPPPDETLDTTPPAATVPTPSANGSALQKMDGDAKFSVAYYGVNSYLDNGYKIQKLLPLKGKKLLVVLYKLKPGGSSVYDDKASLIMVKLNANGSKDTSFTDGVFTKNTSLLTSTNTFGFLGVFAMEEAADEKVVIGGDFTHYNGQQRIFLLRLNKNGTLDSGFDGYGAAERSGNDRIDKLIIGNNFVLLNGYDSLLAKRSADGTFQDLYDSKLSSVNGIRGFTKDSAGRIVILIEASGGAAVRLVRLSSNGSTFEYLDQGTGVAQSNSSINAALIAGTFLNSGKFISLGAFNSVNGTTQRNIVRYNTDGTVDTSFAAGRGIEAIVTNYDPSVASMQELASGKILLLNDVASSYKYDGHAMGHCVNRINSDGSYDSSYVFYDQKLNCHTTVLAPDGGFYGFFNP